MADYYVLKKNDAIIGAYPYTTEGLTSARATLDSLVNSNLTTVQESYDNLNASFSSSVNTVDSNCKCVLTIANSDVTRYGVTKTNVTNIFHPVFFIEELINP